jgi:uncharacterized phiE125 gp8 family phage protein
MLTVTTPANSFDLTVLATVKAELGITDRAEDENLTRWIKQASDAIAKYCNRVFAEETVSETFRLKCREDGLLLARFPVSAITSVVENDTTLTAATDYELTRDGDSGVLNRLRFDREWTWPIGKIVVTYIAGYTLVPDLPYGVERAAILLVNQYRYAATRDPLLRSETTEGAGSFSYFDSILNAGLAPEVEGLLSKLRKPSGG